MMFFSSSNGIFIIKVVGIAMGEVKIIFVWSVFVIIHNLHYIKYMLVTPKCIKQVCCLPSISCCLATVFLDEDF